MCRTIVDAVNRRTMLSRDGVNTYSWQSEGQPVLDLGVGGGDYTGLDYSEPMLAICRKKYPGQRLLPGDAREMPQFPDASFAFVFFSCNGIGMVDQRAV